MPDQLHQTPDPVEQWICRTLARRYADTLNEPVPDSLLDLLRDRSE